LITTNAIAGTIAVGAAALVTLAAVPASASTAAVRAAPARTAATAATRTQTIGSCSSSGDHAACALNVHANRPAIMHARLTATPDQAIKGRFAFQCSNRNHEGAGEAGVFDSRGPIRLRLRPGIANPVTCSLSLRGHLPGSGKLRVSVTATYKG
jgi:hypothetical protein